MMRDRQEANLRHQLLELLPDAVIEEGDCGAKALEIAGEEKYDICFLDINLGDINAQSWSMRCGPCSRR